MAGGATALIAVGKKEVEDQKQTERRSQQATEDEQNGQDRGHDATSIAQADDLKVSIRVDVRDNGRGDIVLLERDVKRLGATLRSVLRL